MRHTLTVFIFTYFPRKHNKLLSDLNSERTFACLWPPGTTFYHILMMMTNSEAWRLDVFLTHHFFRKTFLLIRKFHYHFDLTKGLWLLLFCYCGWLWCCLSSLDLTLWLCQPEIKLMSGGFRSAFFFYWKSLLILSLLFLWRSFGNKCYLDFVFIGFRCFFCSYLYWTWVSGDCSFPF